MNFSTFASTASISLINFLIILPTFLQELSKTPTIVVSGHHAKVYIEELRLIIDQGGGMESNPVAAIVLPSKKLVLDTDQLPN